MPPYFLLLGALQISFQSRSIKILLNLCFFIKKWCLSGKLLANKERGHDYFDSVNQGTKGALKNCMHVGIAISSFLIVNHSVINGVKKWR